MPVPERIIELYASAESRPTLSLAPEAEMWHPESAQLAAKSGMISFLKEMVEQVWQLVPLDLSLEQLLRAKNRIKPNKTAPPVFISFYCWPGS